MKNMIKLIHYDYIATRKTLRFAVIIFAVFWIIAAITSLHALSMLSLMCTAMIFEPAFISANKNDANRVYGVLPIKKHQYVLARYITGTLLIAAAGAISYGVIKLSYHINIFEFAEFIRADSAFGSFTSVCICAGLGLYAMAVTFFCYSVLSPEKVYWGIVAIFMATIVLLCIITFIFSGGSGEDFIESLNNLTLAISKHPKKSAVIGLTFGLISEAAFCLASISLVNKKEM